MDSSRNGARLDRAWHRARRAISLANYVATTTGGKGGAKKAVDTQSARAKAHRRLLRRTTTRVLRIARALRDRADCEAEDADLSDHSLSKLAPLTDHLALSDYAGLLHTCPRLVNVVSLAEAVPVPGSGTSLPLDLHQIASRCSNAFYSPKRFAAVQLAFDVPRSRVLLFHTGRIVGTGCSGVMEARLSVARAVRQMAVQAGVHVYLRNFQIINQVGAASLHARLDCERFATTHSSNAHFDIKSFIGLAWRPPGEACCCEIYGTGRMNLPGSTRERDLLRSFSRMYPQLIAHSDHPERMCDVPEHLRDAHKPGSAASHSVPSHSVPSRSVPSRSVPSSLFDIDDADNDDGGGDGGPLSGLGLPPLASHATDDAAGAYADDQDDEWLLGAGF